MVGNKAQKAVAAALTGMLALGSVAPAFAGVKVDGNWYRINGDHIENYQLGTIADDAVSGQAAISGTKKVDGVDRYDTMFDAINYNAFDSRVWEAGEYISEVVLVSGTSQSDALVAAGYAGSVWGPVITTPGDKLGTQAERAIKYFADGYNKATGKDLVVTIIGGESAVSKAVESAADDIDNVKVDRIAGEDRVDTSLKVAKEMNWLSNDHATAFVANGWAWADALSVSSFAYQGGDQWSGSPILLTDQDGTLTDDEKAYLKDVDDKQASLLVVGGPAQPSVQDIYDAGFKRARVEYKGGEDRYETNALVVEELANVYNIDYKTIAVASGQNAHWPDALIGGAFVGANGGVLVLADSDSSVALKEAYDIWKDREDYTDVDGYKFFIGGESALSERLARKIAEKFA